ncbi:MAG: DUF2183 domain-containing protein [Maribacter sp.]
MALFGKRDKLQIISFQSYGTDTHLYVRGRALEDEKIDLAHQGLFRLFWNSFKRFETDEVKHTKLRLTLPDNRVFYTETDHEGYYKFDVQADNLLSLTNSEGWVTCELAFEATDLKHEISRANRFPGEVLIPSEKIEYGVVSDIDDTILHTGVVSLLKWRVIVNTFFKNAAKRVPLKGAAELYHTFHLGKSGKNANPIFYVSHSPWNLYRYLDFFLTENNFPKGPILLRSMSSFRPGKSKKPHKQNEILDILSTYSQLKFILIGDSGEKDADIYKDIAEKNLNRILAIYLRTVNHKKKIRRIQALIDSFSLVPMVLVRTSEQAIEHAKENGFI